jgi:hypothetical protein
MKQSIRRLVHHLSLVFIAAMACATTSSALANAFLISPVAFDFGNVPAGETASPQTVTVTNVSGVTQPVNLAGGAAGDFGGSTNCPASLAPGASCSIFYAFQPTALGPETGTTALSVSGQIASFSFQGQGISPFLISPTAFDFGNVATGTTSPSQTVTITNVGGATQPVNLAGGAAGDFGGSTNCPASLAPGASCSIFYAFKPTATGPDTGSTTLSVNGQIVSFSFKGIGGTTNAPAFLISPLSFDFGNVPSGETSSPQTVTITNVSGAPQALNLAGGAAGDFGGSTNCPATLAPGASCEVFYAFKPTAMGAETGSTTLSVHGQNVSFSFKGTGIDPFLVSPIGFDFGEVALGLTSPQQLVDILNVSDVTQLLKLAGGAAGDFGGSTNCPASLASGASCSIFYAFTPTALGPETGTTTLTVNDWPASFSFSGVGVGASSSVPEPATLGLLGLALAGAGFARRKAALNSPSR